MRVRVEGGTRDQQFILTQSICPFAAVLFRANWALWFPKTNARSSTILLDELDTGLFEGALHVLKGTRIWFSYSTLEVRNCLRGCFACF